MNIKEIVRSICSPKMTAYLQMPYRVYVNYQDKIASEKAAQRVKPKAEKYLHYYQDDLSREILEDRLEYYRNKDYNIFLRRAEKEGWKFNSSYQVDEEKYSGFIIVYDKYGSLIEYAKNLIRLRGLLDKYRFMTLREFCKSEVLPSELIIVLTQGTGIKLNMLRVKEYLASKNLHNDTVDFLASIREDAQYLDVFSPVDNEIVIDAGSFDGDTALRFLKWGGNKIKHIYSFEFDPDNAKVCEKNLKDYQEKITLVKKGTWDKDVVMYVNPGNAGGAGSIVSAAGDVQVQLTTIDNVVKDEKVTFIKMDVEGAELKSLIGAKNTIVKNHPRLAICAYHKPEDLYELPEYILSLVPEYKFYLRHYSSRNWETVLYAYC